MASGRVRGQTFILDFLVVAQGPLQPELAHHPQASGPAGELSQTSTPPISLVLSNSHTTSDRPHVSRATLHHAPSPAVEGLRNSVVTSASPAGRGEFGNLRYPISFFTPPFNGKFLEQLTKNISSSIPGYFSGTHLIERGRDFGFDAGPIPTQVHQ